MRFRFKGKPDYIFPRLRSGEVYDLEVKEVSKGLFGFLVGNMRPQITKPFRCPYSSWDAFYQNWEPLKEASE